MSKLLIQCSHINKNFTSQDVLQDVSLSVHDGDFFAVVGENGAGKTTLLRLMSGAMVPDAGCVTLAENLTIGFLPQEEHDSTTLTTRMYLEGGVLEDLERKMSDCLQTPERIDEWAELHDQYEKLGGYRRRPLEEVFQGLKLDLSIVDRSMTSLSSGQRVRVALAKALIEDPDVLFLDEPTNHLDEEMLLWMQELLQSRRGATVIVSHDRKFLNETCNHFVEIKDGRVTCYGGNYDFYLAEKERILERQLKAYLAQEEERAYLKQKIKAVTFSKKKPASPSDRNVMAYDRHGELHQKSVKHHLDVLKARLEKIEANPIVHPKPPSITGLRFSPTSLASSVAIECEGIGKAFKEKVLFSDFCGVLGRGDRIVITGFNGCGKTTLLRCIMGIETIDAGKIVKAPTAKIAYLDQEVEGLPRDLSPLEYFERHFNLSEEALRRELHKASLGGAELLRRPFVTQSVGQRKRFMLLTLVLAKPNVLLLDEPTNHLDFLTLEALEKALLAFDGAILAVSHDKTFIDKLATAVWDFASF